MPVPAHDFLDWPFFTAEHRTLATKLNAWAAERFANAAHAEDRASVDAACKQLVKDLGSAGWTRHCAPLSADGETVAFDVRSLALIRETLAWHDGLADFAFAMQGLGSGAISLAGSREMRQRYLPRVVAGELIAAFALSEPDAGSDVAAMACSARRDGDAYVLDGEKTWISNGGIADFYCVFARTTPAETRPDGTVTARGISAFVVDAKTPGLSISRRIDVIAPHPLATLAFKNCRVPEAQRLGAEGEGFKIAMRTLDVFRTSVAGAALGFGQRALDEALAYAKSRKIFGKTLADLQLTQAALADMATEMDAARLLTYRAAWLRDRDGSASPTKEVAMAKMTATESAQRVIDRAVQLFGGRGVEHGAIVERLYRDIRALRIYEGATEVQKLIIGRELRKPGKKEMSSTPTQTLQPPQWQKPRGYSNGVAVEGRQVFIAGQIGWDANCKFTSSTMANQVRQALANIVAVLAEAKGRPEHIVRLTWFVTSRDEYLNELKAIGASYRDIMGKHFPPMSVVQVVALMEGDAKVEIEATAVIPPGG